MKLGVYYITNIISLLMLHIQYKLTIILCLSHSGLVGYGVTGIRILYYDMSILGECMSIHCNS